MPSIVQFYHPGSEHGYDTFYKDNIYYKNWNKGKHKRKFIINDGKYIEKNKIYEGKMIFWCEWEPPSFVKTIITPENTLPHEKFPEYLHYPFLPSNEKIKNYQENNYQNTDPFIFGDSFKYSICRQDSCPVLKNLEKGSIILFGSHINKRFAIDTIFVVNELIKYNSALDEVLEKYGLYTEIVMKMACRERLNKNNNLNRVLYIGATYENKVNGMFSYIPVKKYEGKNFGFSRIVMPDEFYETKNNRVNKYFSNWRINYNGSTIYEGKNTGIKETYVSSINEIKVFWDYLVEYVSKEYVLGYNIDMPKEEDEIKI